MNPLLRMDTSMLEEGWNSSAEVIEAYEQFFASILDFDMNLWG